MPGNLIIIRPYASGDQSFLFSSWIKSFSTHEKRRFSSRFAYCQAMQREIEDVLKSPGTHVLMAVDATDPTVIFAWICTHVHHLLYAYTKQSFRGFGLIRRLMAEAGPWITRVSPEFMTPAGSAMAQALEILVEARAGAGGTFPLPPSGPGSDLNPTDFSPSSGPKILEVA